MRRRAALAGLAAAAVSAAGGCAAPQSKALRAAARSRGLPRAARLDDVPFHAQRQWECGPAALAMAMNHAGVAVTSEALVPEVWIPQRRGALQAEMLAAPRRRALLSVQLGGRLDAPLRALAGGLPVIVFQNLGLSLSPIWHYAVLIGYDLDLGQVVLHTGVRQAQVQSIHPFERTWVRAGAWAMTASPPQHLPAGADEQSIVQAGAALERVAPAAALRTWDAVLVRWPRNRYAALGRGNAAWALGDRALAQQAWQQAVQWHPDFADAWNNLANALAASGHKAAARRAAERAIALGGPRANHYRDTLGQVMR